MNEYWNTNWKRSSLKYCFLKKAVYKQIQINSRNAKIYITDLMFLIGFVWLEPLNFVSNLLSRLMTMHRVLKKIFQMKEKFLVSLLTDLYSMAKQFLISCPWWNPCYPCTGGQIVGFSPCASCAGISIYFVYYLHQYIKNWGSFCAAAPVKWAACAV